MTHAPTVMPAMNVISINEKACVLDPSANASTRVQATSYSMATNPDTPMPITASLKSVELNCSSRTSTEGDSACGCNDPRCIRSFAHNATTPMARFIAAASQTVV